MWNEEHAFEISSEKEAMFEVFDKENVGQDKFMGELKVSNRPMPCLAVRITLLNYLLVLSNRLSLQGDASIK